MEYILKGEIYDLNYSGVELSIASRNWEKLLVPGPESSQEAVESVATRL